MSAYTLHTDEGLVMVTLTGRLDFDTISALLDELDGLAVAAPFAAGSAGGNAQLR
jgi:hypothetical protein